jgi:hypothetical protein
VSLGTSFFSDIFEEVASVAVDHVVQELESLAGSENALQRILASI